MDTILGEAILSEANFQQHSHDIITYCKQAPRTLHTHCPPTKMQLVSAHCCSSTDDNIVLLWWLAYKFSTLAEAMLRMGEHECNATFQHA